MSEDVITRRKKRVFSILKKIWEEDGLTEARVLAHVLDNFLTSRGGDMKLFRKLDLAILAYKKAAIHSQSEMLAFQESIGKDLTYFQEHYGEPKKQRHHRAETQNKQSKWISYVKKKERIKEES